MRGLKVIKKIIISTILFTILMLSACSGNGNTNESPTGQSASPVQQSTERIANIETAQKYVGLSVDELYAAIGEPQANLYQDSCEMPDAQDGFLYYDGFTVTTLKTDENEIVRSVGAAKK